MRAAEAKREAQFALDYIRQHHAEEYGPARCLGYVWASLAGIAGYTGPSPWEVPIVQLPPYSEAERARISAAEADASRWLVDAGYDGATDDQCACILDPTRANDARAMIEHWQIRCGLPAHFADAITSQLRRLPPDHPEDIT